MNDKERQFTTIVNKHKRTIYTVCYMFSNDRNEVEDLFQDILVRMWNGFESFRGESSLNTWVWRVSLNTCLNFERRKTREGERIELNVDITPADDADYDAMQIRQLHERIGRLGFIDRSIILLWLENMSYDEIGAIVGISAQNVSVRLVRIREKLKRM
ncbi:MAG: sigma-70 family RNA polymerase sigma factor [Bacteroidaceae bacterium]|nr:sigma-70 family RNA polymerase sigma factor [Bacteroidaceae bacterium]